MFVKQFLLAIFSYTFLEDETPKDNNNDTHNEKKEEEKKDDSDASKKEDDEEQKIPYSRFKEVNDKLKAFEEKEKEREVKELEAKGEYQKALELLQKEKTTLELENLISKSDLPEKFQKLVKGNTKEEVEDSIKLIKETLGDDIKEDKNKILKENLKGKKINADDKGEVTFRESLRSLFK